ncbi:MAG: hypothetical protein JOZ62_00770 [Acidobacteriaceae bacterium]|nr:hypothetical protein [Acidobacteriaceae bacterium]
MSVALNGAERANVELDIGAGELNLAGGATQLVEGNFEYNVPGLKPVVHSSVNGSHATVTIRQENHSGLHGQARNTWNLSVSNTPLLDLALNCGAGEAKLNLGSVDLRTLNVHMGAGQVDLDLRGRPSRDYDVTIEGGVGQAIVHLPEGVGVRADAHGGLGSIDVTGLEKRGDHYENNLYENAKVNVRVQVHGGVGEIRLIG